MEHIQRLMLRFDDEATLRELASAPADTLRALDDLFTQPAQRWALSLPWLLRVLDAVLDERGEPGGLVLAALARVRPGYGQLDLARTLTLQLLGRVAPEHGQSLATQLALALARITDGGRWEPTRVADAHRILVLVQLLARAGGPAARKLLEEVLAEAGACTDRLVDSGGLVCSMGYPGCGPMAAAAAAGLLALVPEGEAELRQRWRARCVRIGSSDRLRGQSSLPSMPFLYLAPAEDVSWILAQLLDVDERAAMSSAEHVVEWARRCEDAGLELPPCGRAAPLADTLDALADRLSSAARASLSPCRDLLALLSPARMVRQCARALETLPVGAQGFGEALAAAEGLPFRAWAALEVERHLHGWSLAPTGARPSQRAVLDAKLAGAGLSPTKGWLWEPPVSEPIPSEAGAIGRLSARVEEVERRARVAATASPEAAASALGGLPGIEAPPVVRHALARNLLLRSAQAEEKAREVLLGALVERVGQEPEALRSTLGLARRLLGDRLLAVLPALLRAPAAGKDPSLSAALLRAAGDCGDPGLGPLLADLIARSFSAAQRGGFSTAQVRAAYSEAAVALDLPDALARLHALAADPDVLLPAERLALLLLAGRHPGVASEETLDGVFVALLAERPEWLGRADPQRRDGLLTGATGACVLRALARPRTPSDVVRELCTLLAAPGSVPPPPASVPALLERLGPAVQRAALVPGEAWQEHSWGGWDRSEAEELALALSEALRRACCAPRGPDEWRELLDVALPEAGAQVATTPALVDRGGRPEATTWSLVALLTEGLAQQLPGLTPLPVGRARAADAPDARERLDVLVAAVEEEALGTPSVSEFNRRPLAQRIAAVLSRALPAPGNRRRPLDLAGADLRGAALAGADLRYAELSDADLRGACLRGALLGGAALQRTLLHEADLRGVDLTDASLLDADFEAADLRGARLRARNVASASFCLADLRDISWESEEPPLRASGADLRGADLSGRCLAGACLSGADLRGATLRGVDLSKASLIEADLRDADLRSAKLELADLARARLAGADLRGAVLAWTTVERPALRAARTDETTRLWDDEG